MTNLYHPIDTQSLDDGKPRCPSCQCENTVEISSRKVGGFCKTIVTLKCEGCTRKFKMYMEEGK